MPTEASTEKALARWAARHVVPGSAVISDGLACFRAVAATGEHTAVVTGSGPASAAHPAFGWVNTCLGNVKNALHGTYHAFHAKHLPRSLAEFSYRFNRRFDLHELVPRLACIATRTPPLP